MRVPPPIPNPTVFVNGPLIDADPDVALFEMVTVALPAPAMMAMPAVFVNGPLIAVQPAALPWTMPHS